jgi:hypothetical protein
MIDEQLQRMLVLDGAPGPALTISAAHADEIVDAVLDGAGFGPGDGGSGGEQNVSGPRGGAGGAAAGTKLAIVAGFALVVIAIMLFVWRGRQPGPAQLAAPTIDAAIDASATGSGSAGVIAPGPETAASADAEPELTIDPLPSDPPSRAKPTRREPDTADLLGEANAKRAAKQWRESDVLYARVVKRAPKSLAAQTALIASASLHLEHLGDPKGAAQRFRRALAIAPAGALAEEARWGIAEAARANHDTAGEAAALDQFLAHHPTSPLAPRAKARRAELP